MRLLLTCLGVLAAICCFGQEELMAIKVTPDTARDESGPNSPNFTHNFISLGGFVDESEAGGDINNARSTDFMYGIRYKHQFGKVYSIGGELAYNRTAYRIMQTEDKVFPNGQTHVRERFVLQRLELGFYNRINFGKRGKRMGKFVDVGAYGGWVFHNRHWFRDNHDRRAHPLGATSSTASARNFDWVEPLSYGFNVRVGLERWSLWGRYRASDLWNGSSYPELSRISVGLELALF